MKPSASRTCKDLDLIILVEENPNGRKAPLILAMDSEDNSKGKTYMVNFFDGVHHYTFKNTEAAVEWILLVSKQYKKGIEIWCANTQYDIGNLFRENQDFLSFTLSGSRFITGKVYKERVKFKDIFNVLPGSSVKTLGNMIGLPKLDSGNSFENEEYCQRDTEIVYWALLKYRHVLKNLGVDLKNTAASTGFTALLNTFDRLAVNSLGEADHEFMKRGYYGGRTEVFYNKHIAGDIFGYDIVSSYPNCMLDIPLVDSSSKIYTKNPKLYTREGFSDCLVQAPEEIELPYLPVRAGGKLVFPAGEFRGVWTYFELREAQRLGYRIIEHFRSVEFKVNFEFTMRTFVERLFKIRKQAKKEKNDVLQYACKIILNASYGKFAMGNEQSKLVAFDEFHKIKGNFVSEIFPNNQIIVRQKTNHMPSTNYMTAALITAHGRHNLYKHLIAANKDGRTLLYCDTDSIFFHGNEVGFLTGPEKKKSGSGELGTLGKEYDAMEAHFVLPKTYMLKKKNGEEIYRCKGVRGNLAKEFFTKGFAVSMQPLKYVETCRKNFFIDARNKKFGTKEPFIPFNMWVDKKKSKKAKYDKRKIFASGKTKPLIFEYSVETQENI